MFSLMRLDSGICAMGVQDDNDITMSKTMSIAGNNQVKGDTQSETLVQSKYTSSSLKVRKPYTITKQREKWTEEEHQKFLEALKLYGRGWRQIEEHVGTKTAVQIRSHAQKFFSKLERESNGIIESSIQSIVIPPPRHKRKPLHPYPRKPVDYSHGRFNLNEKERPPSPYLLVAERETCSPTSVLSRVDSDSYESAIPEQAVRSISPSYTEMHSTSKSHIEKDNDRMTLKSSEEAKSYWLSISQSGGASLENLFSLKFESNSEGTKSSKGTSANDQPSTGIKLFGRTISISNVENPLGVAVEDLKSVACMQSQRNHVVNKEKLGLELQPHLDVQLSLGMSCSDSNSTQGGVNMNSMEDQKEMLFTVGSVANVSLPGWTFQQGLSTINSEPSNNFEFPTPLCARLMERMDVREGIKESSFTCSRSRSNCELRNGAKKLGIRDSENQELNNEASIAAEESSKSVGISPRKSTGGFVFYKRCLSEIADSLGSALEERKGQRARVCS